jgi:cbb3-type cytochrome oxidase cytochrome c subunit
MGERNYIRTACICCTYEALKDFRAEAKRAASHETALA